jgi:hypothetical protein
MLLVYVAAGLMANVWTRDTINEALVNNIVKKHAFPGNYGIAVWEWRSPTEFDEQDSAQIFEYCSRKKIHAIFLRIDEYIDIYESEESVERQVRLIKFEDALRDFVSHAQRHGVKVYALGGHPLWGKSSHRYIPEILTRYALEYNGRQEDSAQLQGIQFDIEPYTLPDYGAKTAEVHLSGLVETLDSVVRIVEESTQAERFELGMAIPFWYDDYDETRPSVTWEGVKAPVFLHIATILGRLNRSHIAIMAYRTQADGRNGTIALSKSEVDYLERQAYRVDVWIGQEVTRVEPSIISFASWRWGRFMREQNKIAQAYEERATFAGIAINNLHALMEQYP